MDWFLANADFVWRASVGLAAASFVTIALAGVYFLYRRRDFGYSALGALFIGSLLATAVTRADLVWHTPPQISRSLEFSSVANGLLALAMAIIVLWTLPNALRLVSRKQLEGFNRSLAQEVEARKIAEARMQRMLDSQYVASEARLHAYFETASQAIIAMTADLRMRLVNHATEELFGYPRAELIGNSIEMLWPERFREEYCSVRSKEFAARSGPKLRDKYYRRKDGSEFHAETALSFVDTDDGPLAFTMVTDLTERQRAAAELERSNARLTSYIESALQGIVAIDKDGKIVLVNRSLEEMFGYSRDDLLGQPLEMLLPQRYRGAHVLRRQEFSAAPRIRKMEIGLVLAGLRKDGTEFPVEIGLSFVEAENGFLSLGLIVDITARMRAAEQLSRTHEELVRSNTELEQFAYIASHDLQEPLRMITGYLNLLDRRYRDKLDEDAAEFIRYAVDGATRMKGLIQDLLSVSRISRQSVNLQPAAASAILENALINLKVAVEESGTVVTSDALPEVLADATLLTQVFQNLIGNAIKFRSDAPPRIHVSARRDGDEWILSVQDNGIGIDQKHAERIFRIFERLNDPSKYAGSGIGLAITQRIIARHGGRIWVESCLGQGSTFFFSLPADSLPGRS